MNSNWRYSPETPKSGQNRRFFVPRDFEILQMTLKNNRAPLLCYFKRCASFHSHRWIQTTGVTARKRPNRIKIGDFCPVWPLLIQTGLRSGNAQIGAKFVLTSVTLTSEFDLLRRHHFLMVISPANFMMIRWEEHGEKGVTDRRTDGQTDERTDR